MRAEADFQNLSPAARLALAYTPKPLRGQLALVLMLDARLAMIVGGGREELLKQVKLAWWRERLLEDRQLWPVGEPLLAGLGGWARSREPLIALVDGWETLVSHDPLTIERIDQFANGRVAAIRAAADAAQDVEPIIRQWALADLAGHVRDENERALIADAIAAPGAARQRFKCNTRGIGVLATLAMRALHAQGKSGRVTIADLLAAMRVGLFGR